MKVNCRIIFISLLLPVMLFAQQDVLQIQMGSKILSVRPDLNGNVLVLDEVSGEKKMIPVSEVIKTYGTLIIEPVESPADFTLYPGFPVSISNIGYNTGWEGVSFCNMDSDPELEILVNLGQTTQAINIDGSNVPGWPKTISQVPSGGPVFGDIDGDGEGEVVIASYSGSSVGYIYAYEKNGTTVTGFPVNTGYIWMSPTLADLNNDGSLEIIAGRRQYPTGQVIVLKGNGTPLPGWPQNIATVPGAGAAAGDINGDNVPEVIFEALNTLYVWDAAGNLLSGFPFTFPTDAISSYSSPILADVNNDGNREIAFGLHESGGLLRGLVFILKNDGTVYPGWPKYTNYWVYAPPSIGYINSDNILDIAVGDQVLSGTPVDQLYAWDINGNFLTGFPAGPNDAINAQTLIADIDSDNMMELIFDNNTSTGGQGKYHALNHDATVVSGWPLITQGGTFFTTPAITDINFDNTMDMIGVGSSGSAPSVISYVHLWNAQVPYSAASVKLPMHQYNQIRSGIFDMPSIVPVEMESFTASADFNNVILNWRTASELNNAGFRLYRNDRFVSFIDGTGTTTEKKFYKYEDRNLSPGLYTYYLEQVDFNGSVSKGGEITIDLSSPAAYALAQNYPNPFNPSTKIKFQLKENGYITLTVYNMLGAEAAVIQKGFLNAGAYEITFDASTFASGIYFYELKADNFRDVKRMIYLR